MSCFPVHWQGLVMARKNNLNRDVVALGLVSLLNDISSEMIYPLLPLFLTVTLGAGVQVLGLIEGIAETTAALLKWGSGWISDRRKSRKPFALFGYAVSACTRPLMALAASAAQVGVIRLSDRVGKGIRTSPRDALLAAAAPPHLRGLAFGFHRAMDHAGATIGPLIAMAILVAYPEQYRRVFWWAALPAFIGVLILLILVRERPDSTGPSRTLAEPWQAADRRLFHRYLAAVFVFALGNSSDAFLLLRANQLGIATVHLPLLWTGLHVIKMITSVPGSSLSDRIGRKKVILGGWLFYAFIYSGLAVADQSWHVVVLFALYGIYFGLTEGSEKAWVADLVPTPQRGSAYGQYHFYIGIAAFPSSLLMGVVWYRFSPSTAFFIGAGFAAAAVLLLLFFRNPQKKSA
jgi:MFS family permease